MSIENPYGLSVGWRIDPDGKYDRKPSKVTSRQMTDKEIIKYGLIKASPARSVISFIRSGEVKEIREKERLRKRREIKKGAVQDE